MKKSLIFILLLYSFQSFAQDFSAMAKIEYEMSVLNDEIKTFSCILYFDDEQSKFTYKEKNLEEASDAPIQTEEKKFSYAFKIADTSSSAIYVKRSENILYNLIKSNKKDLVIFEDLPALKWTILEGEKKIGSFICNKAEMEFRGRKYTAWFTQSIPTFFGPWKLSGLPGLIIEAYDEKREVYFSVTKIALPFNKKITFLDQGIEKISRDESKKLMDKQISEMKKRLQASGDRDTKINVQEIKLKKGIELD